MAQAMPGATGTAAVRSMERLASFRRSTSADGRDHR